MKTKYIPSLNGLRAVCIFMVVADHLVLHQFIPRTTLTKIFGTFLFNGGLGVSFFFVISGFLITSLLIKEREQYGTISLKQFYLRRALRIFPAYYLLLAVYYLLQSLGYIHLTPLNWISDVTYTNQFFKNNPPETLHLWSLSVEELFYLLWPVLYIAFFSRVNTLYLCGVIATYSFLRFYNCTYPTYRYANTIFSTGDALLIGCLTAINYQKIANWVINHKRLVLLAFPALIFLAFSEVYVFHLVSLEEHTTKQIILQKLILPAISAFGGNKGLLSVIMIALIIVYSINVKSYWYKFLNYRIVNYIGLLSYSIYLWQQIFISDKMHQHHFSIFLVTLLILLSANISYHFIERPILILKDKANLSGLFKLKLRRAH